MKKKLRTMAISALAFVALGTGNPASAMADPSAIDWTASPHSFVTSLYQGVFGRYETSHHVDAWARGISTPNSRLNTLTKFLASPEYKARYGSVTGKFNVYWRSDSAHHTTYTVAEYQPPSFHGHFAGPYTFNVAQAVRDFCQTYK